MVHLILSLLQTRSYSGFFTYILNPFQIVSRLTFLISSLTTRLIQSFIQNITFFVVYWFINKSSSRVT